MPGCFTGISINSPIFSLILDLCCYHNLTKFQKLNTHFIDSAGLTYTNFLRNPGPHPFQICNRIPKRWCWLFLGGGSNHNQFGGVFFQLWSPNRSGFFLEVASKTPKAKALRDLQNRIPTMGPWNLLWILQGAHLGEWFFGSSDNGGALFEKKKNGKQHFEEDQVMVLMSVTMFFDWSFMKSSTRQL